jgi:ParB family transcriptional regulator, chromosome partitioning protein
MSKDRRLGRGLAALLGTPLDEIEPAAGAVVDPAAGDLPEEDFAHLAPPARSGGDGLLRLAVDEIDGNPFQPRREFTDPEIASLAESLKEHDLLQPVLVRRVGQRYQLISGERRLRAAMQAGWTQIPAQVREADDRLVAELAIVENLHRKDLNPIEKALSFKRYLEEHGCSQEDLARRLKIDRSTIANLMRLLELPETVLDGIRQGDLSAGHARALLPLGDEAEQVEMCCRIRQEGLSVRAVEAEVQQRIHQEDGPVLGVVGGSESTPGKRTRNAQTASLEQELRRTLGAKVAIQQSAHGRGKIVIPFANHDEFERIFGQLTGTEHDQLQRQAG